MAFFKKSNSTELSDEELLHCYSSSGNIELLGELYSRYTVLVYGVCLKYLGNREDARDAVMGIFEKLISEVPRHEIHSFRSWLYVISKNFCLMQIRSAKTVEKHKTVWMQNQEIFMDSDSGLHPMDEENVNLTVALKECIERLKAEQKRCIELFYFENKCYQEIADELRTDEKKVKSYLQNGKRNLKICLEEGHEKEE